MPSNIFDLVVKKFGPPNEAQAVPAEIIAEFSPVLPPELILFWQNFGIGLWLSGKFQLCLPSDYASILDELSAGDAQLSSKNAFIIGFSAFGELLVWSSIFERIMINLPIAEVLIPKLDHRDPDDPDKFPLAIPLMRMDQHGSFDMVEDTEAAKPLFDRCVRKLGKLRFGECYGLVPALGLGGSVKLGNFERMNAKTHFNILSGLGRFQITTFQSDGSPRLLRYLGETEVN
jgi:hypothetical protein